VYFGDREVDVAMTELFGGSLPYHGYNEVFPLTQATSSGDSITSITSLITSTYSVVATAQANRMIEQILCLGAAS